MTEKQRMYRDLFGRGYSVQEIAAMTGRTPHAVQAALYRLAHPPCQALAECDRCPTKESCGVGRDLVEQRLRARTAFRRKAAAEAPPPRRGRYSY